MTFNSLTFAVFLPVVLAVYYVLGRRAQNVFLLVASYVFYGWWDWRFLGLLALATVIDFFAGIKMAGASDKAHRRRFLILSLSSNLTILGFFKYFDFFSASAASVLTSLGLHPSFPTLHIVLPVGISFYTFQSMSYAIDVYRGQVEARRDFLTFALFVGFFPQLVAGPIERASRMLPQFEANRRVSWFQLQEGFVLILAGLFKKVGVADALAPLVDVRFQHPTQASGADLLLALLLFSIQIYCDFSGYSDIARGVAKLLGFDLILNFARPYFATSVTEFWRRWHISLSTWLRDYLFLPLSFAFSRRLDGVRWLGLRDDIWIYGAATMTTMLLGGLWHGARWTFVVWGGLHGAYLCGHRVWLHVRRVSIGRRKRASRIGKALSLAVTYALVLFAWVFFRAESFPAAWDYLRGIVHWQAARGVDAIGWFSARLWILVGALVLFDLVEEFAPREHPVLGWDWRLQGLAYASVILVTLVLGNLQGDVPFIYFQF